MTPSADTFSIASAISEPTYSSAADTVATLAISSEPLTCSLLAFTASTVASTAALIPFLTAIGFAPAATFFIPSRTRACARSVAVVVPSPASSLVFDETSLTS